VVAFLAWHHFFIQGDTSASLKTDFMVRIPYTQVATQATVARISMGENSSIILRIKRLGGTLHLTPLMIFHYVKSIDKSFVIRS